MDIEKKYLFNIKRKIPLDKIKVLLSKIKDLKILVIGDTILDEYVFVTPKGRATKDPILSVEHLRHETYAGGVLAVINHISSFVNDVELVTIIGDNNDKYDFISGSIDNKVKIKTFIKENSPTTIKKRYLDANKNIKFFKVEYINESPINKKLTDEIVEYLNNELPKYDLVLVADFGHGFINNQIRRLLETKSKYLCINVQSNSANMGFNYVNLYKKADFISMNDIEIRLPLLMQFDPMNVVIKEFKKKHGYNTFLVTLGKQGSVYFNNTKLSYSPALVDKVVDTVGAGDAVFAISSLFAYLNIDDEIIPFIANCAGGIKANYIGNKESVTRERLIKFIELLYQNVE